MLFKEHPDLFWGVITSMYVGNAMLLVLNLPLIGLWVQLLRVPYAILFPLILFVCLLGSYVINNSTVDMTLMLLFGVLGYLMRKFRFEAAPLVLALILGKPMEEALRQALGISQGSFAIFVERPISLALLLATAASLAAPVVTWVLRRRLVKATS
jgi:putative tricarboxylic transport membrane protein